MAAPFLVSLPRLPSPVYRLSEIPCRCSCGGCSGGFCGLSAALSGCLCWIWGSFWPSERPSSWSWAVRAAVLGPQLDSNPTAHPPNQAVSPVSHGFRENMRARGTLGVSQMLPHFWGWTPPSCAGSTERPGSPKLPHFWGSWPRPGAQLRPATSSPATLPRDPLFRHFSGAPDSKDPLPTRSKVGRAGSFSSWTTRRGPPHPQATD
jgi:hypothetical protein